MKANQLKSEFTYIGGAKTSGGDVTILPDRQQLLKKDNKLTRKIVAVKLNIKKKSPLMVGSFGVLWFASLATYGPGLFKIVSSGENILQTGLLLMFAIMLMIFWMFAAYFIAVVIFSYFSKPVSVPEVNTQLENHKVAILYPTCNDFKENSALSCLQQQYQNFHLFLLDDSDKSTCKKEVDAFHNKYPGFTTVIRRPDRKYYKAGNLNHALSTQILNYPFFVVVDADEILPPDFIQRTIRYMDDPSIGFVQANHKPNPNQNSKFAKDISPTILPFWDIHCRTRNRFGFVTFVGHGALVRRSAWEAANGFPNLITEDLAFSIELRKLGYYGVFKEDLICSEDFPEDFVAFKKQQERYIIGTTQVLVKNIKSVIQSKKINWIEKIDIFMWCSPLYITPLVLLFLILNSVGFALVFGHWDVSTISIFRKEFTLNMVRLFNSPYELLLSKHFQVFSVVCALSPAFASVVLGLKRKLNAFKLIFSCTIPYLSLMIITWRGILGYLIKGRVIFPPTGEKTKLKEMDATKSENIEKKKTNHWRSPVYLEIASGAILATMSLLTYNVGLFAVSCSLLIGAGIEKFGWENKLMLIANYGSFIIILVQMSFNVLLINETSGLAPLIFSMHF